MIELPDFLPLRVSQSPRESSRALFDSMDHVLVVLPPSPPSALFRSVPQGRHLERLLQQAESRGATHVTTRLANARGTAVTAAVFERKSTFANLTWARQLVGELGREGAKRACALALGLDDALRAAALEAVVAAADVAAFALPVFKSERKAPPRLASLTLAGGPRLDLRVPRAAGLGNNIARWFTALPPNVLTAAAYRDAAERLVRRWSISAEFLDERELEKLGAGAFLAVAQGNATRDAGLLRLSYRPNGAGARPELALVGKGILFDTGGTNLKPFKDMLDMHLDMQGSAVALGTLAALAELEAPYAVDAWLALSENRISPTAYKPQDVVRAANGVSIQVIHTDAEGRMALADALALAAREKPELIIDYATLTGACIYALTERYSGVFTNRAAAHDIVRQAGAASGERVWTFPLDEDFDEPLKSDIADVKQCHDDGRGDHILAARFLSRFVPHDIPWLHVDLSAAQHKGGLAHVPTEITGFGVRFTLALLHEQSAGPADLAKKLQT